MNVSGLTGDFFRMDRASRGKTITITDHELCFLGHGLKYLYGLGDSNHTIMAWGEAVPCVA